MRRIGEKRREKCRNDEEKPYIDPASDLSTGNVRKIRSRVMLEEEGGERRRSLLKDKEILVDSAQKACTLV